MYKSKITTALLASCSFMVLSQEKSEYALENGQPPNIIWFMVEDINPYIGCFGDDVAQTPNLDKLAEEGVKFTNVHSVSGVCAPSRAALITGCYPTAIGAHNMRTSGSGSKPEGILPHETVPPAYVHFFTEYLRQAGYYCMNKGKKDYQMEAPVTAWDHLSGHWDRAPEGKPFFLYYNGFMVTHESSIWNNANHPEIIKPSEVNVPPIYPDNPIIRQDIARNYSNIAEMDARIGEYLSELKEKDLLDKSIIVFLSDNGGPLPRGKREIYDTGLKVPMIIRYPHKQHAGTVNDDLISFVDLGPTMLSLAGLDVPETMHGRVFWGKNKDTERKYIYAARDRMDTEYDIRRAVKDKRFKYIRNYKPEIGSYQPIQYRLNMDMMNEMLRLRDNGSLNAQQMIWFRESKPEEELFDTRNDPYELNNLAGNPEYEEKLLELRTAHEQWEEEFGDLGFSPEKELIESWWPNFKQPVTPEPLFKQDTDFVAVVPAIQGARLAYQIIDEEESAPNVLDRWKIYSGPVQLQARQKLAVISHRIGYKESKISYYKMKYPPMQVINDCALKNDACDITIDVLKQANAHDVFTERLHLYKHEISVADSVPDIHALQKIIDQVNLIPAKKKIEIDGKEDVRWNLIDGFNIPNYLNDEDTPDTDISGSFKYVWDEFNLYLFVEIQDELLRGDASVASLNDLVQIYCDIDNSKLEYFDNTDDKVMRFVFQDGTLQYMGEADDMEYFFLQHDGGYTLEIKIPWHFLTVSGFYPEQQHEIGFEILISDSDENFKETQLSWNITSATQSDIPKYFGVLTLDKEHYVDFESSDINDFQTEGLLSVFPNPAKDKLIITSSCRMQKISIYTIGGILLNEYADINSYFYEIYFEDRKNQMLLCKIDCYSEFFIVKVIKT